MNKLQPETIKKQVISCLQAYPAETILGLCFYAIFITEASFPSLEIRFLENITFLFPTLFVITYSFNNFFKNKKRPIYYSSLLTLIPLILLSEQLENFINSPAYGFTLLLTIFLLVAHQKTADNTAFARHGIKLAINAIFASAIGLILLGTICAIYYSIIYIFDWYDSDHFILYTFYFIFYLFIPLLFCRLQQENGLEWDTLPKPLEFVLNFILSPAIIIYTLILYIYFITIATHWELPKGNVAYMVMTFIFTAFIGRMSQLIVNQKHYEWFYRPFGIIAIPPLILFWIGTIHRICAYSFTEARIYLLAGGILMTLYVFFSYSKRLGSYRLMLLISSSVITLLTYIPGISARNIGIMSQTHRMEQLARELSLWDNTTGKLYGTDSFQAKDSMSLAMAKQLNACYEYLVSEESRDKVIARYGISELHINTTNSTTVNYSRPDGNIPTEGYKYYLPDCNINHPDENTIQIKQNNRLLLETDMQAHFSKYEKMMSLWGGNATDLAPFYLQNDSCLVIIESIKRNEKGIYTTNEYDNIIVFGK